MEINKTSNRIHPLMGAAAVSVMLVSLIGVAAITGVLPNSHSSNAPTTTVAAAVDAKTPATTGTSNFADTSLAAETGNAAQSSTAPATQQRVAQSHQSQPHTTHVSEPTVVAQAPQICHGCGRVESVHTIQHAAKPSGLGIAAGAVLGGVLGNQVGGGNGRTLATVAGAVGGGYAGNEVEKRTHTTTSYQVRVRMDDGSLRTFSYAEQPAWGTGARVRVVNGHLTARA